MGCLPELACLDRESPDGRNDPLRPASASSVALSRLRRVAVPARIPKRSVGQRDRCPCSARQATGAADRARRSWQDRLGDAVRPIGFPPDPCDGRLSRRVQVLGRCAPSAPPRASRADGRGELGSRRRTADGRGSGTERRRPPGVSHRTAVHRHRRRISWRRRG